jgi:hypothetical protein
VLPYPSPQNADRCVARQVQVRRFKCQHVHRTEAAGESCWVDAIDCRTASAACEQGLHTTGSHWGGPNGTSSQLHFMVSRELSSAMGMIFTGMVELGRNWNVRIGARKATDRQESSQLD